MTANILVVDDDSSIRESLSKVLRAENYEIFCAESCPEALERLAKTKIDLLLLDLGRPVEDGWGAFEMLARVHQLLPVIVITGCGNQREAAEKAGADAFLEKPLAVPRLLQTIGILLAGKPEARLQKELRP